MSPRATKRRGGARAASPRKRAASGKHPPHPRRIADLTWQVFSELVPSRIDRVLVPVGTMEAHGVLPLGTDVWIPERLAERLADPLGALIAPAIPYGITSSLLAYPGSMTLSRSTFVDLVTQVGSELHRNGFQTLIFLNGHGGQTEELRAVVNGLGREAGRFGMVVEWWPLGEAACREIYGTAGGHAGVDETAAVVALAPDLVQPARLRPSLSYRVRPGLAARPAPAPILHFGEESREPSFDPKRAARYLERLVEEVRAAIQEVLDAWKKNLPRR